MDTFLIIFSIATGCVTLWSGGVQALDYRMARTVARAESFPIKIRRPVTYASYLHAVDQFRQAVNRKQLVPDVVIGIQYSAMGPAAEIAKIWRLEVWRVETRLREIEGSLVCEGVAPKFDLNLLIGKRVMVVDNSIRSGRTLHEVVGLLRPHAAEVTTCVLHRPSPEAGSFQEPDFVIFESKHSLKHLWR